MEASELTWQDCKKIVTLADALMKTDTQKAAWKKEGEQAYYEEVLKLYRKSKQ